ncbi:MAG TPA: DNA polymerase III subunit gamma/tau [Kofleriaceae bacterium]|nr:DNA polymerase III subunit gamma/tau [Kofleriaceae bacterium]
MSYLVLARKYRPQTFSEVVGQEHVTRTLANAFKHGRVHHAFLLCGPRGVGKTTLARILGKALNCERGPGADPCGVCDPCAAIASGTAVDYYEMDGASNRGIDAIRDLTEAVKYQPAAMRKKVYVIDEVHMLTTEAFNALLKTLEEPPPHVTFILATTEPHKVPVTILSRCQRYDFKLVPAARLAAHLRSIFERESFEVEPAAVDLLVRESGGSVRDALSLSDQVISYVGVREIREAQVAEVLGVADRALVRTLVEALARGDARAALEVVDSAVERGLDEVQVARALTRVLHDIAIAQVDAKILEGSAEEQGELARLGREIEPVRVRLMCDRMMRACQDLAESPEPRIVVDLALIDLAALEDMPPIGELIERLAELERRLGAGGGGAGGGTGGGGARRAPAAGRTTAAKSSPPAASASAGAASASAGAAGVSAASAGASAVPSSASTSAAASGASAAASGASAAPSSASAAKSSPPSSNASAAPSGASAAPSSTSTAPSSASTAPSIPAPAGVADASVSAAVGTEVVLDAAARVGLSAGARTPAVADGASSESTDVGYSAGSAWAAEMSASLDGPRGSLSSAPTYVPRGPVAPVPRGPEASAPNPLPRGPEGSGSTPLPRGPEASGPAYVPRGPEPGGSRGSRSSAGVAASAPRALSSSSVLGSVSGSVSGSNGSAAHGSNGSAVPGPDRGAAPVPASPAPVVGSVGSGASQALADPLAAWGEVMAALEAARELTLLGWYQHAVVLRWDSRGIELGFPAGAIVGDLATEPRNVQALGAFLQTHFGGPVTLSVRVLSESDRSGGDSARSLVEAEADRRREEAARRSSEAREHPVTKMVLDTFGASIEEIKTDV